MAVTKLDFDFLAWVERCLFVKGFYRDLLALGISQDVAWGLSHSEAITQKNSVVALYQAYGQEDDDYSRGFMTYMDSRRVEYERICKSLGTQDASKEPVKPVEVTPEAEAELKKAMTQCALDQLGSGYVDNYYRNFAGPFVAIAKWWAKDILNGKFPPR